MAVSGLFLDFLRECRLGVFVSLPSYLCVVAIFLFSCIAVKQVLSSVRRALQSTRHFRACIPPRAKLSCAREFNSKYTFLGTATVRRLSGLGSKVSVRTICIRVHVVPISRARASPTAARFALRLGLGRLVRRRSVVTAAVIVILVVVSADQVLFVVVARARTVTGLFR